MERWHDARLGRNEVHLCIRIVVCLCMIDAMLQTSLSPVSSRDKYSYSDKKTYSGRWVQNLRHGHGVLRMGTLTSGSPSVFMGNWDNDKRSGYGMMDDIMRYDGLKLH